MQGPKHAGCDRFFHQFALVPFVVIGGHLKMINDEICQEVFDCPDISLGN